MAASMFDQPQYRDPEAARAHLEALRWPSGPVCPHCGAVDRITKLKGKSHRPGLYDCGHCRDQFTVTVGTVFERSKVSLDKWLFAAALMAASKKGVSSKQVERMVGVTYKTAWFMTHRLREAMKPESGGIFGGGGGVVEIDETFLGRKPNRDTRRGWAHKEAIFTLVERNGAARSWHVPDVTAETLKEKLLAHVHRDAHLMSDNAGQYRKTKKDFPKHETVNHYKGEYVRGETHVNTAEGFFSIFKRGIFGIYQHVSTRHLERYTTEFDFRYSYRQRLGYDDNARTNRLLKGISGRRLMYSHAS